MRKIFVLATGVVFISCTATAQCDTKTEFTASKTEFIKQNGDVESKEDPVILTEDKKNVDVLIGNGKDELQGSVTDYTCNFSDANNGTISFKSEVTDKSGDVRHATFTIETQDGKTTIMIEAAEEPTKIRLTIGSSETL